MEGRLRCRAGRWTLRVGGFFGQECGGALKVEKPSSVATR